MCQYKLKEKDSHYSVIVQTDQKYIIMTEKFPIDKYIDNDGAERLKCINLTFLDSFLHMSNTLSKLIMYWKTTSTSFMCKNIRT